MRLASPRLSPLLGTTLSLSLVFSLACDETGTVTDPGPDPTPVPGEIALTEVAAGFSAPVYLTAPEGDLRLFVVEQGGRIRIIEDGQVQEPPFLDLTALTDADGERGLLSMAFHPDYATNGYVYVNYTDNVGTTVVERYTRGAGPGTADPASAVTLLEVPQPYANHNGGQLQFGPDGMLYIGMGDGGSGGDPEENGQDPETLLGSLLRIDVDAGSPYAIPSDNPFAGGGGLPEIWAIGLRNPWRFSFDESAGTLFVADVGQNRLEEINAVEASAAGLNYGWNTMEGTECYASASCETDGLTIPVHEYTHDDGCSVTGGYVYRGTAVAGVAGHYFYSDYCAGWLRSFQLTGGQATDHTEWDVADVGRITSFGRDANGEVYVLTSGGRVYRIDPAA